MAAPKRPIGSASDSHRKTGRNKRVKLDSAGRSANTGATSTADDGADAGAHDDNSREVNPSLLPTTTDADATSAHGQSVKSKGHKVKKLAPPRPFPTVPAAVSATGPRSAHHEGKNRMTVTRKTALGAYLRRCKDLVVKDGYKSLHLYAMGAAIPHLALLAASLPSVLPHAPGEVATRVLTGTVNVQDEVVPDDEDEDVSYRTRDKSSLSVVLTIGDGVEDDEREAAAGGGGKWGKRGKRPPRSKAAAGSGSGSTSRRPTAEATPAAANAGSIMDTS